MAVFGPQLELCSMRVEIYRLISKGIRMKTTDLNKIHNKTLSGP